MRSTMTIAAVALATLATAGEGGRLDRVRGATRQGGSSDGGGGVVHHDHFHYGYGYGFFGYGYYGPYYDPWYSGHGHVYWPRYRFPSHPYAEGYNGWMVRMTDPSPLLARPAAPSAAPAKPASPAKPADAAPAPETKPSPAPAAEPPATPTPAAPATPTPAAPARPAQPDPLPMNFAGDVKSWSLTAWVEGSYQEDDLWRAAGGVRVASTARIEGEAQWSHYHEDLDGAATDDLGIGELNLLVRVVQNKHLVVRTGVGLRLLADGQGDTEWGGNIPLDLDIFPIRPLVISIGGDLGNVGDADYYGAHGTVGVMLDRFEIYAGYEAAWIEDERLDGPVAGLRVWF